MKVGKISESVLKRSIFKYIHTDREEMKKGAALYSDCAFFALTKSGEVLSATQTVALPAREAGRAAVYSVVNSIAAGGGKTKTAQLALTLPEAMEEKQLQELICSIQKACKELDVQILGGHTEVSRLVQTPVISITGIGEAFPERNERKPEPEKLDIVATKWIGLEGTYLLATEKEKELLERYPYSLIRGAQLSDAFLSVQKEAEIAWQAGAAYIHDVRNGGIFGGLWELAGQMQSGIQVDLKKIPIKQETIEVCEFFELNPYELLAGGSLLIACENGQEMISLLAEKGVPAEIIGRSTKNNDKIVINEDEIRYLERTKPDEIYKVLG